MAALLLNNFLLIYTQLRLYNKMTMEVILSTAFGRAIDVQGGKGGKLFESAVAVFSALAPPKENERTYAFRILQFLLCKFSLLFHSSVYSSWHELRPEGLKLYSCQMFLLPFSVIQCLFHSQSL